MKRALQRGGAAALLCLSFVQFQSAARLTASAAAASPSLSLPEVLARLRTAPAQFALEAEIAALEQQIAETSGRLSQSPTVELAAGSRRGAGGNSEDLDVNLELPLLARASRRTELMAAFQLAAPSARAFAACQARADAATAYVDAWEAQELEALRHEALALQDRWLAVAEERTAAGSLAGYEVSLLRAERAGTAALLAEASARRRLRWEELRATFDPGGTEASDPPALAPAEPATSAPGRVRSAESSLALEAVRNRAALDRALAGLSDARDRSRWSLRPGWAREGEEDIARLGIAWRIPRGSAESSSGDRLAQSLVRQIDRQVELDTVQILARRQSAALLADTLVDQGTADHLRAAGEAIEARWLEGKAGLAEILPLRRQLLAAAESDLGRRAARARAEIEWHLLSQEMER